MVYTAADILQYLSGKLSPAQMHAMEKAALDDPFLAEAMEGYEAMQTGDWEKELALLKNNLPVAPSAKLVPLPTVRRYNYWKVAAAVLVLVVGTGITYLLTNKTVQEQPLAVNTNTTKPDTAELKMAPAALPDTSVSSTTVKELVVKPATAPKAAERSSTVVQDSLFVYKPGKTAKDEASALTGGGYVEDQPAAKPELSTANSVTPEAAANQLESYRANEIARSEKKEASFFAKKNSVPVNRNFAAQVVGPDNTPLPFANVSVVKEQVGTYADARGNFRLVSSDSLIQVQVKSAGYVSRYITLNSATSNNKIMLAEDNDALKEKTLVAGKAFSLDKSRRVALVPDSVINVEPADGWSNYDTYITNNLSVPDDMLQKKIHGEVELSFEVESNGAITNLKVDKSLCQDCDEAALKAIKDGPRWKVKKGRKATAKVKVKF